MIVPPSPTTPRSPLRRVLRAAGLVLAPALLVIAVAVGLAGPKADPGPTPAPSLPTSVARATLSPAPATTRPVASSGTPAGTVAQPSPPPGTVAQPSPPAARLAVAAPPAFPDGFATLASITPAEANARRSIGNAAGAVVVRGFLKVAPPDGTCAGGALGPLGPWCARTGILADRAWAVTGADFDPLPPHLHVTIPVGVRLPEPVAHMAMADAGPPLPVEVLGRYTGSRCDPADLAWCEEPFVVDRITWADGTRAALTPLADDRLQSVRRPPNPFQLAVSGSQTPLLAVLAWPPAIEALDSAASAALAGRDASEPVWYLRVLEADGQGPASHGGRPGVHWILLDEKLLTVLATGRTGAVALPIEGPAG